MSETQQVGTTYQGKEQFEDEVELMDYLRVIWKWKYLILFGTVVSTLAAVVISFNMAKVYVVDMVVRPGILRTSKDGTIYINSAKEIRGLTEGAILEKGMQECLQDSNSTKLPGSLEFDMPNVEYPDWLKISHETSNPEVGIDMLRCIGGFLLKRGEEEVMYYQKQYDEKLRLKKIEAVEFEVRKHKSAEFVKVTKRRIAELTSALQSLDRNAPSIEGQTGDIANNGVDTIELFALLHRNSVQQEEQLENSLRRAIYDHTIEIENEKVELVLAENSINKVKWEIENLEEERDCIQNMKILRPPSPRREPVRPRTKLHVVTAGTAGFFVTFFLSFFLEYVLRYRKRSRV